MRRCSMPDPTYGAAWTGPYPADQLARRVAELGMRVHELGEAAQLRGSTYRQGVRLRLDETEAAQLALRNRLDALEARLAQLENTVTVLRSLAHA